MLKYNIVPGSNILEGVHVRRLCVLQYFTDFPSTRIPTDIFSLRVFNAETYFPLKRGFSVRCASLLLVMGIANKI